MIEKHRLQQLIDGMGQIKVLVIGDVMLDVYENCAVKRISPEAPVPVATIINESEFLGGAGNVANNARALGASVSLVSVIGNDREGCRIQELLNEANIDDGVVVDSSRPTTLKRRIVSGTQQLLRVDREVVHEIGEELIPVVCEVLKSKIQSHDVIIISDYCKGLLTEDVINYIKSEAQKGDKKIFVDSKSRHLQRYSGVHLIKPNKIETEMFVGESFAHDYSNLEVVGKKVCEQLTTRLVVTLGGDGMAVFEGEEFLHMKTKALHVFDVSGAGDTVLSAIAVAVGAGANLSEAAHLSNHAAGYVVSRLGTTVCDLGTLRKILEG